MRLLLAIDDSKFSEAATQAVIAQFPAARNGSQNTECGRSGHTHPNVRCGGIPRGKSETWPGNGAAG